MRGFCKVVQYLISVFPLFCAFFFYFLQFAQDRHQHDEVFLLHVFYSFFRSHSESRFSTSACFVKDFYDARHPYYTYIYIYIHPLGLFSIFWGWQQQLDVHLLCKDGFCLHRDPSNHLSLSWLFSKTAARTVRRHALHDNAVSKPFLCERTWEDFQQPISGATMEEKKTKIKDLYMYLKQTINSYWSLLTTFYLTSSDEEFKPTVKRAVHPSSFILSPAQPVNKGVRK